MCFCRRVPILSGAFRNRENARRHEFTSARFTILFQSLSRDVERQARASVTSSSKEFQQSPMAIASAFKYRSNAT